MSTRQEIYEAIEAERRYQAAQDRFEVTERQPMEHLAIIEYICQQMRNWWYENSGQPPMDFMRKIAATAVYCMEQHGAPRRKVLDNHGEEC